MKESVSLSSKRIFFEYPLFTKTFQKDVFIKNLEDELGKKINIIQQDEVSKFSLTPCTIASVKILHLLQTKQGLGVIVSIKMPSIHDVFFYLQGDKFMTQMVDPNTKKVTSTIFGDTRSVKHLL